MSPYEWWWHGAGFMWMFPFLVIVGMVLCALFMVRGGWWHSRAGGREQDESALDILDKRFARGEINRSTYDEMRQALRH